MTLRSTIIAVAALLALAGPSRAFDTGAGETADAIGAFPDAVFVAGETVTVAAVTDDDIFAAGRQVTVRDTRADHLFVAGGQARIESGQTHDALVMAGEADFTGGSTLDDVIAAAGRLLLSKDFQVGGSAMVSGGDVTIASAVGGDLVAAGGEVRLDSAVAGDADLTAEHLVIGPNARIGGNLTYKADSVEISPQAVIVGQTKAEKPRKPHAAERGAAAAAGAVALGIILFVLGCAVLTLALVAVFPGLISRSAARIETWPLSAVGIGFLIVLLGPAAIVLLCFTGIGVPLALTILAFFLATGPLALSVIAYAIGQRLRRAVRKGAEAPALWPRLGWTLAGVVVAALLFAIPFIGVILWVIAYVVGMGAVVVEGRKALAAA